MPYLKLFYTESITEQKTIKGILNDDNLILKLGTSELRYSLEHGKATVAQFGSTFI